MTRLTTFFVLLAVVIYSARAFFWNSELSNNDKKLYEQNWNKCLQTCNENKAVKCHVEQITLCKQINNFSVYPVYPDGSCDVIKLIYAENNPTIKFLLTPDHIYFFEFNPNVTDCYPRILYKGNHELYFERYDLPSLKQPCWCEVKRDGINVEAKYY